MSAVDFDYAITEIAAKIRAFIRRRVRDVATADELAEETLLKVYHSCTALRDGQWIEAGVYRAAHTTSIDFYPRNRASGKLPANVLAETAGACRRGHHR